MSREKKPVELKLYSSYCRRNVGYMMRIRDCADSLQLNYTLERITDDHQIAEQGFEKLCYNGYCSGCRAMKQFLSFQRDRAPTVPVLTANGQLLFRDIPPTDEALRLKLKKLKETGV